MMRGSPKHEWDWPQRARRAQSEPAEKPPTLNARIVVERVQLVKPRVPLMRKIAKWYLWTIVTIIKVLIAVPLTILIIGGLWLLWTILTLPRP
jgi:hypothetical protein